jgi:hypothetical protein
MTSSPDILRVSRGEQEARKGFASLTSAEVQPPGHSGSSPGGLGQVLEQTNK